MTEGLQLSLPKRINLIRITLVLSLLISVLLSLNLWCGDRSFPVTRILQVNWLNSSYDFIWIVLVILFLSIGIIFGLLSFVHFEKDDLGDFNSNEIRLRNSSFYSRKFSEEEYES